MHRPRGPRALLTAFGWGCLCVTAAAQHAPGSADAVWTPPPREITQQRAIVRERETAIDPAHQYTLSELVDLAERYNPRTRAAWEAARARAGQLTIARADLLPALAAAALAGTSRQGVLFGSTFVRQTIGLYEPVLRVNYLLFDFGDRASRIEAARDQLLAADFAFNTVHLDVLFATERLYYQLLNAEGQRAAAEVNLKNATTVREAVNARLEVGLATLPDALEARAQEAQARYDVEAAIGRVDTARGDLLSQVGASPMQTLKVQPLDDLQLPDKLDVDVREAIDRGIVQRPELGQQVAQRQAAEAAIKSAHSAFLPSLNFSGYGGEVRAYGKQDQLPGLYAGPLEVWDVRLELRWDLFDGGRRFGELTRAHAEQRRAQAEIDRTRDDVEAQVWAAYVALRTAFQERDAATALLQAAQSSYQAALKSYQLGVRNTVDVVTAQRELAEALRVDVAARTDLLTQVAAFSYRTGDLLHSAQGKKQP